MSEKMKPDQAVRLLRAKSAELENRAKTLMEGGAWMTADIGYFAADIALIATTLADFMEYVKDGAMVWGPPPEDWGRDVG